MEPKITELNEFKVVGLQTYGNPANGDFASMCGITKGVAININKLTNDNEIYGIETYTEEFRTENKWFYMIGREVSDFSYVPEPMTTMVIPKNTYAVFKYKGAITPKLGEIVNYIYNVWLPSSGYVHAGPYDFEKYGEDFIDPKNENSIIEIYIPIKKA